MRIITALFLALFGATSASAADLFLAPETSAPSLVKWSGAYVGIMGGYDFNDQDVTIFEEYSDIDNADPDLDAVTGRVSLGYDVQLGSWIAGSRVYYGVTSGDDSVEDVEVSHMRHYGVLARLGRVFGPSDRLLGYATFGYQWRDFDLDGDLVDSDTVDSDASTGAVTAGAGVEYALTEEGDVRLGAEYEHLFSDTESVGEGIKGKSSADSLLGSLSWRF